MRWGATFEREEPSVWHDGGTYVETAAEFEHTVTHEWNQGLGEIVSALLNVGLTITGLVEHDSVPWEAIAGQMVHLPNGEYRLSDRPLRLPHTYTLQAILKA